jgi:hypothetical protein
MNELVEQLAAQAGLGGALAQRALLTEALLKEAAAKNAKAVAKKSATTIPLSLRNKNRADTPQTLSDILPLGEPPRGANACAELNGDLVASAGEPIGPALRMRYIRRPAGELFKFGRDRTAADRTGEIIAGTPRLR